MDKEVKNGMMASSSKPKADQNLNGAKRAEDVLDESDEEDDVTVVDKKNKQKRDQEDSSNNPDCPVCLQPCIHPVQLPCRHIFCFLCVKGVANRSRKCALCRQIIPPDFFLHPTLLRKEDLEHTVMFDDAYQWFYEGANGWWQYDDRTSIDIETHFKKKDKAFELLIAGFMYIIDFENMIQCRRNDRTKKRRIKRDLVTMPNKKGIAGLKIGNPSSEESDRPGGDGNEAPVLSLPGGQQVPIPIVRIDRTGGGYDTSLSPPTPSNTPQTPQTPSESPPSSATTERDLSIHLERLHLGDSSRTSSSPPLHTLGEEFQRISNGQDTTRLNAVHSRLQELENIQLESNQVEEDASTPTEENRNNFVQDCDSPDNVDI